jgi:SAM-dependent methyltransferase
VIDYDAELQLHAEQLRASYDIQPWDRVLDVGCGTGQTTRDAARLASAGEALGLDIDREMIARAREIADRERVRNVRFEVGDAQACPFRSGTFDVAVSRFGTMFFSDPAEAFRNIARAVRDGGRLVMMVWQAHDRNDWAVVIDDALGAREPGEAAARGLDPFSLAEPAQVRPILTDAGFADIHFEDVDVPVFYGRTVDDALGFVSHFAHVSHALNGPHRTATTTRLRGALEARASKSGVWLGSRAWIITALRR